MKSKRVTQVGVILTPKQCKAVIRLLKDHNDDPCLRGVRYGIEAELKACKENCIVMYESSYSGLVNCFEEWKRSTREIHNKAIRKLAEYPDSLQELTASLGAEVVNEALAETEAQMN